MAISKSLRRLLRVRQIEEEQIRTELERSQKLLHGFENTLEWTSARAHRGRILIELSSLNGDFVDRQVGYGEMQISNNHAKVLHEIIEQASHRVDDLREGYLGKRVERLQAETLFNNSVNKELVEQNRREQQQLDDWYQGRRIRQQNSNK